MMTELLFYEDGYKKEIEAEIVEVRGNALILDRTIFYAESGGQPGDRGFFGPYEIVDTQKDKDGEFLHILKKGSIPAVGDKQLLALDWNHRYKFMQEHSAQHMLSAIMFNEKKIGTVAVHQGEEILTIETNVSEISDEELLEIEDIANETIAQGLRIYQQEMSHEKAEELGMRRSIKVDGDVKVVFIESLDAVACGGIHVANTREIREVVYRGKEMIRGHVRTMWSSADEAKSYRRENDRLLKEAYKLLSADKSSILSDIERLIKENSELSYLVKGYKKKSAEREFEDRQKEKAEESILSFITDSALDDFQELASAAGKEVFILERDGKKGFLYFGTKDKFLMLRKELSLKGGGKDVMFRGAYSGEADEVLSSAIGLLSSGQ